jgi:hypothetical protein
LVQDDKGIDIDKAMPLVQEDQEMDGDQEIGLDEVSIMICMT